jgi:hypothetical protein
VVVHAVEEELVVVETDVTRHQLFLRELDLVHNKFTDEYGTNHGDYKGQPRQ